MFYDLKDYKNDIKKIKENVIEIAKNYNIEWGSSEDIKHIEKCEYD